MSDLVSGPELRAWRVSAGLSQEELAARMCAGGRYYGQSCISKAECGFVQGWPLDVLMAAIGLTRAQSQAADLALARAAHARDPGNVGGTWTADEWRAQDEADERYESDEVAGHWLAAALSDYYLPCSADED